MIDKEGKNIICWFHNVGFLFTFFLLNSTTEVMLMLWCVSHSILGNGGNHTGGFEPELSWLAERRRTMILLFFFLFFFWHSVTGEVKAAVLLPTM